MRYVVMALLAASSLMAPLASATADNGQLEATIASIDIANESLALDDGHTYRLSGEFNFDGLSKGTRVYVFYREEGGERHIFDLEVVN